MRLHDFDYNLPENLIAKTPMQQRSDSRLFCVDGVSGARSHRQFRDVLDLLEPGDLLVFNDTRVIPARIYGHKASGGKIEVLVERVIDDRHVLAHIKASKSPKVGATLVLEDGTELEMLAREGELFSLRFPVDSMVFEVLERIGHMPLPPYIDREDEALDRERYQTVYSRNKGAVAAPTAGLHFDQTLLDALTAKGVAFTFVTLHVGAGTFQPVRVDNVREHQMHSEMMHISSQSCEQIQRAKASGKRVVAVGTTSVRCLETAAAQLAKQGKEGIGPYQGDTDIFIYPGYQFRIVDALITNFHLPQSTLLMLVSAFSGYSTMMAAYREAVAEGYRFFSYGDAMFLTKNPLAPDDNIAQQASGDTSAIETNE